MRDSVLVHNCCFDLLNSDTTGKTKMDVRKTNFFLLKKYSLYLILLFAFLNAVLRLSADSKLTLFRLLLPYSVLLITICSTKIFLKFLFSFVCLGFLGLIQHFFTAEFFFRNISFDFLFFLEYYFHYSCILVVFFMILCLKEVEGENFKKNFFLFLTFFLKGMCLFILIYTVVWGKELMTISTADNINNVGCMFAAGIGLLLVDSKRNKFQYFWCGLIAFLLIHNDSKAAFLGVCFEIFIFHIVNNTIRFKRRTSVLLKAVIVLLLLLLTTLFFDTLTINTFTLLDLVFAPIQRILEGNPFPNANTSVTFRTNSTIAAIDILLETYGVGVGFGNTGRILKEVMVNVYEKWSWNTVYSLHNWWLELMCDFGWSVIFLEIYIFVKEIIAFFLKTEYTPEELQLLVLVLSFPLWSISASGLITEYYTLSVLFFTLTCNFSIVK